jgi:F0F1-type ATP synthase epsilon subunit
MKKTFSVRVIHQNQGVMMRLNDASLVECRVAGGQVGIMAMHVPWMSVLEPGPLRVHTGRRVHELLVRGGLIRVMADGRLSCMVQDIFDDDHIDVEDVRKHVVALEARQPFPEDEFDDLERDLSWHRQCLGAVERHLGALSHGVDHEEEE